MGAGKQGCDGAITMRIVVEAGSLQDESVHRRGFIMEFGVLDKLVARLVMRLILHLATLLEMIFEKSHLTLNQKSRDQKDILGLIK